MKITTLLHITDLHLGAPSDRHPLAPTADSKDKETSVEFRSALAEPDGRNGFLIHAQNNAHCWSVDLLVCTGDLGWRCLEDCMQQGADYVGRLADACGIMHESVLVAPGNHDVNQKAEPGRELDLFQQVCKRQQFVFPRREKPALLERNGIPIVAINTCLGGTEHAPRIEGLPEDYYQKEKAHLGTVADGVPEALRDHWQFVSMDIPALGQKQRSQVAKYLAQHTQSGFAVIAMHHNPLPTGNLEIRPYSNILDNGPFLLQLTENNARVLALHGHTHSDSTSRFFPQFDGRVNAAGHVTSIGSPGFALDARASARLIRVYTRDSGTIIKIDIERIERHGAYFRDTHEMTLKEGKPVQGLREAIIALSGSPRRWRVDELLNELNKTGENIIGDVFFEDLVLLEPQSLQLDKTGSDPAKWLVQVFQHEGE